ncbi:nucleotidyltransferase domain-containing protein [Candidatus Woesearchaeota archaeon]|nr:nucleotidyltransferase domain-containing protein [Candidatus Woesearchaeota archaeon]
MEAQTVVDKVRALVAPKAPSPVPRKFVSFVNRLLQAAKIDAEAMLGGSFAKNTYLEDDHDVDVYVLFGKQYRDEEMSDLIALALGGVGGLRRVHGSRDYFQLTKDGYQFEIVPVLAIARPEEARNVTDVSQFHVQYVQERLEMHPGLADEIRLAKLFCKAAKCYGAESYLNGFSGHVLDLLMAHYGSFLSLLEAAVQWPDKFFLDPSGKREDASFLNAAKRAGPLVLLDPMQPNRNAAAALSRERYDAFRKAAAAFLQDPDERFFTVVPLTKEQVVRAHPGRPVLCYALSPLAGSRDVVGTKLLKAHGFVVRSVKEEGFSVVDEGFEFGGERALCFLVVAEEPLPATKEVQGPPVRRGRDADRFRAAHDNVDERRGRLYATEPRVHRTLRSLFLAAQKAAFFKERVAGAKVI